MTAAHYMEEDQSQISRKLLLAPAERALLRLMVAGYSLEEASSALGLSPPEARSTLKVLQVRCGVSNFTRLIVLAILKAWV